MATLRQAAWLWLWISRLCVTGWCAAGSVPVEEPSLEILSQPKSQAVTSGRSATFAVRAAGTSLRYHWYRNGQQISGATRATYTISNVQPAHAGSYSVVVSNRLGWVTSDPATLEVRGRVSVSPLGDQTVDEDGAVGPLPLTVADLEGPAADLTVEAGSSDPALVPPGGLVLGGADSHRTIAILPATNQYGSTVVTLTVRNPAGESGTTQFTLTVRPVNDPPVFGGEPPLFAQPGQLYSWNVGLTDPDPGDALELTALTLPSWLSLDPVARVLSGVPGRGGPEGDAVVLQVRDGAGAEVLKTFRIWTEDNITVTNATEIEARRQALIQYVWGSEGWPTNCNLSVVVSDAWWYGELRSAEGNLARADIYVCPLGAGLDPYIYHFQPIRGNGRLFVLHTGHFLGGFYDMDVNANNGGQPPGLVVPALLKEGYAVLAIDMPLFSEGLSLPRAGRLPDGQEFMFYSHDDMFRYLDRPMRFFVEPLVVALNHLQDRQAYRHIYMTGLSGGGWATTVCAALDPRIERSFPVAGSVPNYLRVGFEGLGDSEQEDSGFYRIANYKELYVMGAAGSNRLQLQLLNRYDSCCFYGTRHTNWVDEVTAAVEGAGPGTYRFWLDETHTEHKVSSAALALILNALPPDLEAPAQVVVEGGEGEHTVPLQVSTGSLNQHGEVTVSVEAGESELLQSVAVEYTSPSPEGTLRFRVASNRWGSATIRLIVRGDWSELAVHLYPVRVDVRPPDAARILSAHVHPSGSCELRIVGPVGCRAVVQSTADLTHWVSIHTVILADGVVSMVDPAPGGHPARFYRVEIMQAPD